MPPQAQGSASFVARLLDQLLQSELWQPTLMALATQEGDSFFLDQAVRAMAEHGPGAQHTLGTHTHIHTRAPCPFRSQRNFLG